MTTHQFDHGFNFHKGFGYIILYATILLFLLALASRLGRRRIGMTLVLVLLTIVQVILGQAGGSEPVVGIFHPIVAFLILGLAGRIAFEAWWGTRRAPAAAAP
jgi:lipopolysaccharide export LptBFGC system permease protein LptF